MARNCLKFLEPEKYECKKKAERDRLRLYRLRKKLEKGKQPPPSKETVEEENQTSKSFTSKQSLSCSIKKSEKALPFSPRKKKDVISGLAERYKLRIKYVERRGLKAHTLTEEQQKWLDDAFDRPDIT